MKRFLIIVILLLVAGAGGYYAFYQTDLYLGSSSGSDPEVMFRAEGDALQVRERDSWQTVSLRGTEVFSTIPGHLFSDFAASQEDYARWLEEIGGMGANTVQVSLRMDDEFYEAFYEYNTAHEDPLWLIQGITVPDDIQDAPRSAYDSGMMMELIREGKQTVDVIHGRRDVFRSGVQGSGSYRKDVSLWVLGMALTAEFGSDNIAYTDRSILHDGVFEGEYFATSSEATPFEAMLAQVMEEIMAYETGKYQAQRPVGFRLDPATDFLEYDPIYARQLQKYAAIDAEHIQLGPNNEAGRFLMYRIEDVCPDFSRYLSAAQKTKLGGMLTDLDTATVYQGYLALLAKYHSMPVVADYSASSARGLSRMGERPQTEKAQGETMVQLAKALEQSGWAGGVVSTWQDVWSRTSWNTAFASLPENQYLWHDLQTPTQSQGLMAFLPGEETVCTLDGDPSEWAERDRVLETGERSLSARYDAEGLYLMIQGVDPKTPLYIPLDISSEVGAVQCREPALTFDRNADFVLCLQGETDTRLLVQERYDAARENFLYEMDRTDPFVEVPAEDSDRFVCVYMPLENPLLVEDLSYESRLRQVLGTWETGRLVHGNGDPASTDYDSRADFCFGEDCAEIRIPWLLINMGDPANMQVHRDYYTHYGVEFQPVNKIWLGLQTGQEEEPAAMAPLRVKGWNPSMKYRERLKQSYFVLQEYWKGGKTG